jgi:Secretion system C-terminal sorting domain
MKTIFKLLFLLLFTQKSFSQIYYSNYLDETSEWRVLYKNSNLPIVHQCGFVTFFFDGFEDIDGYTYYKMYTTGYGVGYDVQTYDVVWPQTANETHFIGYLREDPNGKFYFRNNQPGSIETVYFDNQELLNAQVGNSYFDPFTYQTTCPVGLTSSMSIFGANAKTVFGFTEDNFFFGASAVEGIGVVSNVCESAYNSDNSIFDYKRIHCYTKQGQTVSFFGNYNMGNKYTLYIDCNTFPQANRQSLHTSNFNIDKITVFPNPVKNSLNIANKINLEISSISIYNTLGQLVQTITDPTNVNDVSNLKTGAYFVKMLTDKGIKSSKFVKE